MMKVVHRGKISFPSSQLNFKMVLEGGQSFRWRRKGSRDWVGVFSNIVWNIQQEDSGFSYTGTSYIQTHASPENLLADYFRLNESLDSLYSDWSRKDSNFEKAAEQCFGIRMLNQDPVENVFSFICSSNNNITRITSMVEKLCSLYGEKLGEVDGEMFYAFPKIEALASECVEEKLRKAGFGYRAKFIQQAAKNLVELGGADWLHSLKSMPYSEAKKNLVTLQGVGPKVADCICLMSLGHLDAVPVDTHVFQIASEHYLPHLKSCKSVTARVYNEIGDFFRTLYGPYAGWAHTILFCADLSKFKKDKNNGETKRGAKRKSGDIAAREPLDLCLQKTKGKLHCSQSELNLRVTLNCGQTYRWKEIEPEVWRGVFAKRVWTLHQHKSHIEFTEEHLALRKKKAKPEDHRSEAEGLLKDYFRLEEPLLKFYEEWSSRDEHFSKVSQSVTGLRMTKQNIVENLFAFICSSNTTIARITSMVESLCQLYGTKIVEIDGVTYYDFPEVSSLAKPEVGDKLRAAKFGFRAKYVQSAAAYIVNNGSTFWFERLKEMTYSEAKAELMKLPGVGEKVADCICLTALDHLETIPVDTHVFQVAKKYYLPNLRDKKSVSDRIYAQIGQHFRQIFGHYSGWAHTVLFYSDLVEGREKKSYSPGK